ncbi:putative outer membrane protein A [hydrothermal vent metagenome]|uniref:Putative outer membrane protein A n=1 Tax=hydrothermal vent metagenome TaxID=652676 RepID=A0A1W1CW72_9ZZZZ
MKKIILLTTIIALTSGAFAGGKYVKAVETEVVPIPTVIDPLPLYVGVGAIATFIQRDPCPCKPNGKDIKDHQFGTVLRVGWDFNQYVGVEARTFKTLGSDNFSEVKHYGIYMKPQYHIGEQVNIYALLGYGKTTIHYTNGILSCSMKKKGFSYGVGLEYDLSKDKSLGEYARDFDGQGDQEKGWGIWADFQHLLSNAGSTHTNSNVVTAGITYDF